MIVYRVFPYLPTARPGAPGHSDYLHRPQGKGRLDNPGDYDLWYFAVLPEGAVGEVFGDLTAWVDGMFDVPFLPGARRALGRYELPDDLKILDLDDARPLLDRGLRPTQVVGRNRSASQTWALQIFRERTYDRSRKWAGVRWWSFQRPQWPVIGLWVPPGEHPAHRIVGVDALDLNHPAVFGAARTLAKTIADANHRRAGQGSPPEQRPPAAPPAMTRRAGGPGHAPGPCQRAPCLWPNARPRWCRATPG